MADTCGFYPHCERLPYIQSFLFHKTKGVLTVETKSKTETQANEVLAEILEWQTERSLEGGWRSDALRGELGIEINENFTIQDLFADKTGQFQIIAEDGFVFGMKKGGKLGAFLLELKDGGFFVLSKTAGDDDE